MCNATMNSTTSRFNLYLMPALLASLLCGCATSTPKPPEAIVRIHAEATEDTSFARQIKVFKNESTTMIVYQTPMLSEGDLVDARVVEVIGGFAIALRFNPTGKWNLDQYTSLNIGRHYAIFVTFGKEPKISRWIAAPIISDRITDGMIIFTPDCTREEAVELVGGLLKSKVASEMDRKSKEAK